MSLCPNCGKKSRYSEDKADSECEWCGYKSIKTRTLSEADLIYCEDCGNHYLDNCQIHERARQHSVVPKVITNKVVEET